MGKVHQSKERFILRIKITLIVHFGLKGNINIQMKLKFCCVTKQLVCTGRRQRFDGNASSSLGIAGQRKGAAAARAQEGHRPAE